MKSGWDCISLNGAERAFQVEGTHRQRQSVKVHCNGYWELRKGLEQGSGRTRFALEVTLAPREGWSGMRWPS